MNDDYSPWIYIHQFEIIKHIVSKPLLLIAVGRRIRTVRLRNNISQEDLAAKAGLDRTYVGGLERGEQNATLLSLEKICTALGVNIHDLFARTDE